MLRLLAAACLLNVCPATPGGCDSYCALAWEPVTDTDLAYYSIRRATAVGEVECESTLAAGYFDIRRSGCDAVNDGSPFVVRAVNTFDDESSEPSNPATILPVACIEGGPCPQADCDPEWQICSYSHEVPCGPGRPLRLPAERNVYLSWCGAPR